ncbi:Receptor-like protein 2 [Acorus gramineus]|uniref:Receptor-like protein 2 n=1 Tax=Acorus gramineus TaxID=55184 RepID=A0AAV9ADI4_ACOGR|nr:Receptor-like protein 2 [Acorus gramineus]
MLQTLTLRNNSFTGNITIDFTSMVRLSSLDLGSNRFTGPIPDGVSSCVGLERLNLARNGLVGEIPQSFKSLRSLSYLSLSNNSFSNISSALRTLQQCQSLSSVVLTMNFFGETLPIDGIEGFKNLSALIIANCGLLGSIPSWLRGCRKMQLLDLSWNRLEGSIPSVFEDLDELFYLDLSNNSLVGDIPKSITQLKSLMSRNASLQQSPNPNFPFFVYRNETVRGMQYKKVQSFPPSIDLSNNRLSGPVWPEFGKLGNLIVLDLSTNNLSGGIPRELSKMRSLEKLDLSNNDLTGAIPPSLVSLNFLSSFSVSHNNLCGLIPTGGQFSTFTCSSFSGNECLCGECFSPCVTSKGNNVSSSWSEGIEIASMGLPFGTGMLVGFLPTVTFYMYYVIGKGRNKRET